MTAKMTRISDEQVGGSKGIDGVVDTTTPTQTNKHVSEGDEISEQDQE